MLSSHQKYWLSVCVTVVGILLISWASTHSASYQVCQQERYASGEKAPDFSKKIAFFFVCEGVTIDANGELLTALGTLAVAFFTLTLWRTSDRQAGLTRTSIELATKEFTATHRPQIKVRNVSGPQRSREQANVDVFQVAIANAGESPAIVTGYRIEAVDKDGEEGIEIRLKPQPPLGKIELASGEGFIFETELERPWDEDPDDPHRDGPVIAVGVITYQDLNGITRHTGFARETISGGSTNYMKYYAGDEYQD